MIYDKSSDVHTLVVEEKARWTAKSSAFDKLNNGQKMQMLGAVPPEPPPHTTVRELLGDQTISYPPSNDWRNINGVNYLTPIKTQGQCQSCVAFSMD